MRKRNRYIKSRSLAQKPRPGSRSVQAALEQLYGTDIKHRLKALTRRPETRRQ